MIWSGCPTAQAGKWTAQTGQTHLRGEKMLDLVLAVVAAVLSLVNSGKSAIVAIGTVAKRFGVGRDVVSKALLADENGRKVLSAAIDLVATHKTIAEHDKVIADLRQAILDAENARQVAYAKIMTESVGLPLTQSDLDVASNAGKGVRGKVDGADRGSKTGKGVTNSVWAQGTYVRKENAQNAPGYSLVVSESQMIVYAPDGSIVFDKAYTQDTARAVGNESANAAVKHHRGYENRDSAPRFWGIPR